MGGKLQKQSQAVMKSGLQGLWQKWKERSPALTEDMGGSRDARFKVEKR